MSSKKLGVVVFGAGMAGKIRIRDLLCTDFENINWNLLGFVSRRQLEIEGTKQLTEEEALEHPDVGAVIVCTEPAAHEDVIRKALKSNKHVLVEFPVTSSAPATTELYTLAKQKELVLHEENIALITPGFLTMKDKLQQLSSPIVKGELTLSGNYNGWVEDFEKSGGPFCVNVSLIQSMYELLGSDVTATGGQLDITEEGFKAVAKLSCSKCRDLTVTLKRSKERTKREKTMTFTLEDGTVITDTPDNSTPPTSGPQQLPKKPGLFMQDFLLFMDKVHGMSTGSEDIARSLHCIKVADDVHKFMGLQSSQ